MLYSIGNCCVNNFMALIRRHIKRRMRMNKKTDIAFDDSITLGVPMFIRLLEFAREDVTEDIALHFIAEKCVDLTKEEDIVTMDDYADILEYLDENSKN